MPSGKFPGKNQLVMNFVRASAVFRLMHLNNDGAELDYCRANQKTVSAHFTSEQICLLALHRAVLMPIIVLP